MHNLIPSHPRETDGYTGVKPSLSAASRGAGRRRKTAARCRPSREEPPGRGARPLARGPPAFGARPRAQVPLARAAPPRALLLAFLTGAVAGQEWWSCCCKAVAGSLATPTAAAAATGQTTGSPACCRHGWAGRLRGRGRSRAGPITALDRRPRCGEMATARGCVWAACRVRATSAGPTPPCGAPVAGAGADRDARSLNRPRAAGASSREPSGA